MRILAYFLASFWLVMAPLTAASAQQSTQPSYSLGVVPQFPQRQLLKIWQPIIEQLELKTGFRLQLQGTPNIPAFENAFLAGQFDFVYLNPYHLLQAHRIQGYQPLIKDGSRQLQGILVVKRDSPIQTLAELNGTTLVFPSPNAFGASLLMRAELQTQHGIDFTPRYVHTHSSVFLNVALDQFVAGGGVLSTLQSQPLELQDRLRVLYRTQPTSPHPLAAHPRVNSADQHKLQQAILELSHSPEGQMLLAKIPMHTPTPATADEYLPLQALKLENFAAGRTQESE